MKILKKLRLMMDKVKVMEIKAVLVHLEVLEQK